MQSHVGGEMQAQDEAEKPVEKKGFLLGGESRRGEERGTLAGQEECRHGRWDAGYVQDTRDAARGRRRRSLQQLDAPCLGLGLLPALSDSVSA